MSINSFGMDVNQLGTNVYPRTSYEIPPVYFTGIVEDIIINNKNGKELQYEPDGSNIGEILVRIIPDDRDTPLKNLRKAYPLEANVQSYPLIGEQVIIYKALETLFYSRSIASTRKITDNSAPFLKKIFSRRDATLDVDARELARQGAALNGVFDNIREDDVNSLGTEYSRNSRARLIRVNEGDVVVHGRYGNVIRMGSSLFKTKDITPPQPNIILTAGLWPDPVETSTGNLLSPYSLVYENLDNDASSIWMVADQAVEFTPATLRSSLSIPAHLISAPIKTADYTGAQIFINSDRVILNSKKNEISLFSNTGINLSALGAICLDTENIISLRSFADINLKADNKISLNATSLIIRANTFSIKAKDDYAIQGKRVFIGTYGTNMQPLVLGNVLADFLKNLINEVKSLKDSISDISQAIVKIPGAQAVVAPDVAKVTATLVETTLKLSVLEAGVTSKNAIFNSIDNFTAKTNT